MERTLCAVGLGALCLMWATPGRAVVLCAKKSGVVVLRAAPGETGFRSRSSDASSEGRSRRELVPAQCAVRAQPATLPMTVALLTSCPAQSGASPVPSTLPESVPWVIEQPSTAL